MSMGSADSANDSDLSSFIRTSSRMIDKETRRTFYPRRRSLKYDLPDSSTTLYFDDNDILEIKGLSHLNGSTEIDSSVYNLRCGESYNLSPYDNLDILDDSGSSFSYSGTPQGAIRVDAVVGFHSDYQNAWIDSGASLTGSLASGVTTGSISGSAGENSLGLSPRFDAGQILRISGGTSIEEYMQVLDTAPFGGASHLRLKRGINGTTAQNHAASATIDVFEVEPDIEFCTRRLAVWAYGQSHNPFTNTVAVPQMGIIEMPSAWPVDVKERLSKYKERRIFVSDF